MPNLLITRTARVVALLGVCTPMLTACSMQAVNTRARFPAKVRLMRTPQRVEMGKFLTNGLKDRQAQRTTMAAIANSRFHSIANSGSSTIYLLGRASFKYTEDLKPYHVRRCVSRDRRRRCTKQVKVLHYQLTERCAASTALIGHRGGTSGGGVLFQTSAQHAASRRQKKKLDAPKTDKFGLCTAATSGALTKVLRGIIPQTREISVSFNKVGGDQPTERAMNAVRDTDFVAAESLFKQAIASDLPTAKSGWAHYNLGVLYYLTARFKLCVSEMDEAQRITETTSSIGAIRALCQEYDR